MDAPSPTLKTVRITALRQCHHTDLMARYEWPQEHPCTLTVGQVYLSHQGRCPAGFCPSAWNTLRPFVRALARGQGHFYGTWMRNPYSAMLSCNDGFRPMTFLIETVELDTPHAPSPTTEP